MNFLSESNSNSDVQSGCTSVENLTNNGNILMMQAKLHTIRRKGRQLKVIKESPRKEF